MKLLFDTHAWLWQSLAPERLSAEAKAAITSPQNETYLSVASMWEIIIKASLGKLSLPMPATEYIPSRMAAMGDRPLPIEQAHVLQVAHLPLHHKDPFDRLLVAQAQSEGMCLLTADPLVVQYEVQHLRVGAP